MDQNPPSTDTTNGQRNGSNNGEKKVGPIIATLVIVLVLIIAALYVFASRITQPSLPTDQSDGSGQTVQPVTGTSTSVDSLKSDLNAAVNGLDQQNF
ncbi:MAG: hypothetical protein KGI69_00155 [Patescibacteria group bacterium]|nr:hypothetical protein [Patescibacteria group bacterium]